jgi:hypothetical protein
MQNNIFIGTSDIEGNVGIGKLSHESLNILKDLSIAFDKYIHNNNSTTLHIFTSSVDKHLSIHLDKIRNNPLWKKLCTSQHCKVINVKEMDELYYSNFTKTTDKVSSKNLYGSTSNIVIHRDCERMCTIPNVRLYRVLIGLSDNLNVVTKLNEFKKETSISFGDYLLFDYSRTHHQVYKRNQEEKTPRKMLKLHFLVFDNGTSDVYMYCIKYYFIMYNTITRYIIHSGTDPGTFSGFFWGIMAQSFYFQYTPLILISTLLFIAVVLHVMFKKRMIKTSFLKYISYIFSSGFILYVLLVTGFYFRYLITGIK